MKNARHLALLLIVLLVAGIIGTSQAATTITTGFVTSFDGTSIRYNLFRPASATASSPVPIIFQGPGWSSAGATSPSGLLGKLVDAGYAGITWDPRGFGSSGGKAQADSQDYEVRDVQKLMDFVAGLDWVAKNAPGDPVMGMVGVSYGGGIQLEVASADSRVDAIVPQISWNNLPQSLKPNGVLKLHWDLPLYGVGVQGSTNNNSPDGPKVAALAPEIHQSTVEGIALNDWSQPILDWYADKSPGRYINGGTSMGGRTVSGIQAPALIMQGANDTLFPLNQGIASWKQIMANGVDSRIIFFCGTLLASGDSETTHTIDPTANPCATTGAAHMHTRARAWFDHYLLGQTTDLGPAVDYQTQDGVFHSLSALPATTVSGGTSGTLVNAVAPTSGAGTAPRPSVEGLRATIASGPLTAVGLPRATVILNGAGPEAYLFFKLLDVANDGSAVVIDDQTMPLKATNLSATNQTFIFDLAGISWTVPAGHTLQLEVTTTSNEYASARTPALVNAGVSVTVPVV